MKIKFSRKIGQVSGKSLYEIYHDDRLVGYISKMKDIWNVDCETLNRQQRIRNFVYLKTAKEYVKEILS